MIKRTVPVAIAVAVGLLTFIGLLFNLPQLSTLLLSWAGFLVAVALLLGVLNLFAVHLSRLFQGNGYSGVLVLGMLAIFALAITDDVLNVTENGVETIFQWVQVPLEAGVASLLAFVLLFAGFELLRRQRSIGALLFLLTAVLVLLSYAFTASRLFPDTVATIFLQIRQAIDAVFVTAGMRGILIGVALGTITLSIRLLVGAERPYNK